MALSDLETNEYQAEESRDEISYEKALKALVEGLIFIAGEDGLSLIQMQSVIQNVTRNQIQSILDQLKEEYADPAHGFELTSFGGRYKFISKEMVYSRARRLYEEIIVPSLSSAALETLAIIAYRQPITRVEIEQIRGVSCDSMLKKLQARELIETDGRAEAVGKPLLYKVTEHFMDIFGMESLDELPEMSSQENEGLLFGSVTDLEQSQNPDEKENRPLSD